MRSVAIPGATGSIGQDTIDQIARAPDGFIAVETGFFQVAQVAETVMDKMSSCDGLQIATVTLDSVLDTDRLVRIRADETIQQAGQ